ncbi:MAG: selenocysteine-specific translation elongation factor [Deltaproteobacteria bacterium]|nr:selenocysteine-specific translation elongation factor [Deltaproteobacteria bacterium]
MATVESKNKRAVVLGTCGHIDHGKTSLVRALTGVDTDSLAEEKKRGVSIDLGFAWMELGGEVGHVAVVDVPGHDRFIRNMLAGATGIDIALLCVAADDGVMPQTIEHLDIINLLGITKGIVVVTKSDLVAKERVAEVGREVSGLLLGTSLEGASVIGVSTHNGEGTEGVDELRSLIKDAVAERLSAEAKTLTHARADANAFRLPIDRSFSVKGFGTVVTGTIFSGSVKEGDEVLSYPSGKSFRVRGIESHHDKVEMVSMGSRAAINLSGLDKGELKRGEMLTSPSFDSFKGSLSFDCAFESLKSNKDKLKSGRSLKLYHMTSEVLVSNVRLSGVTSLAGGERGYGRIYLKSPLLVMRGDRFILRDPSVNRTIAGGRVLLPYIAGDRASALKLSEVDFKALALSNTKTDIKDSIERLLDVLLLKRRIIKLKIVAFVLNISISELEEYLVGEGASYTLINEYVAARSMLKEAELRVIDTLKRYHKENPAELGLTESALLAKILEGSSLDKTVSRHLPILLREGLLKRLVDSKASSIERSSATYLISGHKPASVGADKVLEDSILKLFGEGALALKLDDIIKENLASVVELKRVLRNMTERATVVRIKEGLYMSAGGVIDAKEKLVDYLGRNERIKAADFRDLLGCGRKLAIEILEYFDSVRVTLRSGDLRSLR